MTHQEIFPENNQEALTDAIRKNEKFINYGIKIQGLPSEVTLRENKSAPADIILNLLFSVAGNLWNEYNAKKDQKKDELIDSLEKNKWKDLTKFMGMDL